MDRPAPARLGRIFARLAVHMINALRLSVIRLEFVVGNRPGRRDAAVMFDFAEILFAQAKERRAIKFRIPADVIIRVRMQFAAVGISPQFFRVVAAMGFTSSEFQFSFSRLTNGPRSMRRIFFPLGASW